MDSWIISLLFFLITGKDPEITDLLTTENFEEDYNKILENLKSEDAERIKQQLIDIFEGSKDNIKAANDAYSKVSITKKGSKLSTISLK